MRARKTRQGLRLQAVAGTHTVLLGMSMPRTQCPGHLGFAIHRTDHEEEEAYWLRGLKTFAETDPGFLPGSTYPTNEHPIQGFTWSDFSAKPGRRYTYRVRALRGTPRALEPFREVAVDVETEGEHGGDHDIFFNRGAAASQEYARRFGNTPPDEQDPTDPRWTWLSRGAMEAIRDFVAQAKDGAWGLRVSAYEFRLDVVAEALAEARRRGVDVRILYDACNNPPDSKGHVFPRDDNRETVATAGLKGVSRERVTRDDVKNPPISHHKFIVLLRHDRPVEVLTGSTNFSRGGVFGQSNVVHVVEDRDVATRYLECWNSIAANPDHGELRDALSARNEIPDGRPPAGTTTVFSPQRSMAALDWYVRLAGSARDALFMTFAFGINKRFLPVYKSGPARLRYALLDKLLAAGVRKDQRPAAEAAMRRLRAKKENRSPSAAGSRSTGSTAGSRRS